MKDQVKLSVLMPADVHRRLKLAAALRTSSVQQIMEEAARSAIERLDDELAPARSTLSPREAREWQEKLRYILEGNNREASQDVSGALKVVSKLIALQAPASRRAETSHSQRKPSLEEARQVRRRRAPVIELATPSGRGHPPISSPFDLRLDSVTEEFDRLIRELCTNPREIYKLEPRRFEELIAEIWKRMGYMVELTPETRDGGRDVIATRYAETRSQVLIECKKYAPERTVGIDIVQRLLGALYQYNATQGVLTTTSKLTRDALRVVEAKPNHLTAHQYRDVVGLLWRVRMIVVPTPELWLPPENS